MDDRSTDAGAAGKRITLTREQGVGRADGGGGEGLADHGGKGKR